MYFGLRVAGTTVRWLEGATPPEDCLAPGLRRARATQVVVFEIRLMALGWIGWRSVVDRQDNSHFVARTEARTEVLQPRI